MSLPRDGFHPGPVETARVAQAAFPDGNVSLRLRDELGTLVDDALFTPVYASQRRATGAPSLAARPAQRPAGPGESQRSPGSASRARPEGLQVGVRSGSDRRRL